MTTFIDILREFQILIAGSLAIVAAWIGARALNRSTKKQIKIQTEHFNRNQNFEKITLGKTLIVELKNTVDIFDTIYYENYEDYKDTKKVEMVVSAVESLHNWYGDIPKPLNSVFSNNMHKLGLFGEDAPALILVAYESQDNLHRVLKNISLKLLQGHKNSLKRIKWQDLEMFINAARDGSQLAIEFIEKNLDEIEQD